MSVRTERILTKNKCGGRRRDLPQTLDPALSGSLRSRGTLQHRYPRGTSRASVSRGTRDISRVNQRPCTYSEVQEQMNLKAGERDELMAFKRSRTAVVAQVHRARLVLLNS